MRALAFKTYQLHTNRSLHTLSRVLHYGAHAPGRRRPLALQRRRGDHKGGLLKHVNTTQIAVCTRINTHSAGFSNMRHTHQDVEGLWHFKEGKGLKQGGPVCGMAGGEQDGLADLKGPLKLLHHHVLRVVVCRGHCSVCRKPKKGKTVQILKACSKFCITYCVWL